MAKSILRILECAMVAIICLVPFQSCYDDIDGIDDTPINKDLLQGGWTFVGVDATINSPMKNVVTNVTKNFMQRNTVGKKYFYFLGDTAYVVTDIDNEDERACRKSAYHIDNYTIKFDKEEGFFGSWYVPFWYVKDQNATEMTFYLTKDEIVKLLYEDGSIEKWMIEEIDDGICELYLDKYEHPFFNDIKNHADNE